MNLSKEEEKILKGFLEEKNQENKRLKENKAINDGKEIEWYAALVNANFATRFELDRQLLTIASAAIGLLVTFMNKITSCWLSVLWLISGMCFLITIILALNIFKNNRYLLENIINGKDVSLLDESLKNKDTIMKWSFIIGVISLFLIAVLNLNVLTGV